MTGFLDTLLMVVVALNFAALGSSRVRAVIHAVAIQGVLIGLLPLVIHPEIGVRGLVLVAIAVAVKGFLIPALLIYAMREVDIRHEVRPTIGFIPSLILGAVGTILCVAFAGTLPLEPEHKGSLLVPAALSTVLIGFLMLTTRKMAINHVLGFLILENGVFMFGMLLLDALPALVEVGTLLDLFTGVFVMGIIINHINREIATVDTDQLSELKEETT